MKTPDKIYIGIQEDGFIDCGIQHTPTCPNEYICKDALLEWIQEVRAIPHDNGIIRDLTFQEIVNKLNSM